jgi:hypothetical protein
MISVLQTERGYLLDTSGVRLRPAMSDVETGD